MNKHVFNYEMTEMHNYASSMIYTPALKQDPKNKQARSLLSTRNFQKVMEYDSSGELEENNTLTSYKIFMTASKDSFRNIGPKHLTS
jgi:hypothetical protein